MWERTLPQAPAGGTVLGEGVSSERGVRLCCASLRPALTIADGPPYRLPSWCSYCSHSLPEVCIADQGHKGWA